MVKKLWIDVTMLVNWSGKMTGIQRVEYNLAKRFALKDNVRFFVFDKGNNILIDFDFKHIEYKINTQQDQSAYQQAVVSTELSGLARIRHSAILDPVRPLYNRLKPIAKTSLHKLRNINAEPQKSAEILAGDTVLILSGDWSDDSFVNLMLEKKEIHNFHMIQIVYDMLPALYPGYFVKGMPEQFASYMKRILPNSDKVLAISESTKRDIVEFGKRNSLKKLSVDVFRLGDDFVESSAAKPDFIKGDFILTVGTFEARKNHQLIYYAYREAMNRGIDLPPVVVAGKKGWLIEDLFYLITNDPIISKKFIFVQPTDKELAWLYKNCLFTLFPSFYEGWGLPVAETLFNGKLCLSSNSSSMPEIAGDLIDYYSPNDPEGLLEKIVLYLENPELLKSKEDAIKAQYKPTSWDGSYNTVEKSVSL